MRPPRRFWRLIHLGPRLAYALGLGPFAGRFVLLPTTIGRKSSHARVTPLVYERLGGTILIATARGEQADWLRNIRAGPRVRVWVRREDVDAMASVVPDSSQIADYLERQMRRNPRAFGAILRSEGFSSRPRREELLAVAPKRPMVAIQAVDDAA